MPAESKPVSQPEIAHILCTDIVGYSKLLIDEQKESMRRLSEVVRNTQEFRRAEAAEKLIRIPTGDGMVLVFFSSPAAPVECALEIAEALRNYPRIQLRMGVHSGPVDQVSDVNERANVAGGGINMAQRVMDCGDAGHILLSKRVAEDLAQYARWQPQLHDLGEATVKHGVAVNIFNLCSDRIGNPAVPTKLERERQDKAAAARTARTKWRRKMWLLTGMSVALIALTFGVFLFFHRSRSALPGWAKDKSIAVLPFANLSRDPDNAYFADGIQEEILARLSKIAELKVISRTSTQKYKSAPDNLREIAHQLGVTHILEGTVQKAADQVRVNVQLINATTDAHLWAEIYDRKLTDIFGVESDIAKTIADTLQAKLTGAEEHAIAARPTENTEAYELYHKGRSLWGKRTGDNIPKAIGFYEQAITRDSNYALAYAGLSAAYILSPFYAGADRRVASAKAKEAALKALRLDPNLAEAHLALGKVFFFSEIDLAGALREYKRAIELKPNDEDAHHWYGNDTLSALGQFEEAIAEGKRSVELDPLSIVINVDLGVTFYYAHRYDDAARQLRKTLEIDPTSFYTHYNLGILLQVTEIGRA